MTQDIIALAREAGIRDCICNGKWGCLERFAHLVAAKEREACAKVCEDLHPGLATVVAAQYIRARGTE
jgi:hypothetical protein